MKEQKRRRHNYETTGDHDAAVSFHIGIWGFRDCAMLPLYPYAVEETVRRNRFTFREEFCRFLFVIMLQEGEMIYRSKGKNFRLVPGKVLLIPPGSDYSFSPGKGGYHKLVLELKGVLLDSICSGFGLREIRLFDFPQSEELISRIRGMGTDIDAKERERIPKLLGESYALLFQLAAPAREKEATKASRVLASAQMLLSRDFDRKLNFSELPAQLGVGRTTLDRLFRDKVGISPQGYRNACRIEYARELLTRSDLSIKEIAYKTGYCNQFYFSQEFRRQTGYSPHAFRLEQERIGAVYLSRPSGEDAEQEEIRSRRVSSEPLRNERIQRPRRDATFR